MGYPLTYRPIRKRRARVAKNPGAPKKITEHEIQCGVVKHFRAKGYVVHGDSNGVSVGVVQRQRMKAAGALWGWPDIVFMLSGGKCVFVELKRAGNKEQPHQETLRRDLLCLGHNANLVIAGSVDDAVSQIQAILDRVPHRVIFFQSHLDHYQEPSYTQADLEDF